MRILESKSFEIVPSLLSADFARLAEEINKVELAGGRILHLDVMDGHFVPNITFGPVVVRAVRAVTDLYLDAHLMIDDPARYLTAFADSGVDEITIHQEITADFIEVIKEIKKLGLRAGVSIRPATPVEVIKPALRYLDLILIMSVEPGFGGQSYITGSERKIAMARELADRENPDIIIAVDGGITLETAPIVARAGATRLIAGSAIFRGDVVKNIRALRGSVEQARAGEDE